MFPLFSGSLSEVRNMESSSNSERNNHDVVNNTRSSSELFDDTRSKAKLLPTQNSKHCSTSDMDNKSSFVNKRASSPCPKGNSMVSIEDSQVIEMDGITTTVQNQPSDQLHYVSSSALSTTSEGPICRICHEGEEKEDLLSPCHCTGTVGLLHLSCLETWLGSSSRTKCELCGFEYTVDSQSKPFKEWIRHPSSPNDRRNLICDVACFILLTPLAIISSWLCLIGAQYYSYWAGRWEVPGLISLTVFLMCIYLTWCLVVLRYHYHVWTDWKKHNQIVRIKAIRQGNMVSRDLESVAGNTILHSQRNNDGSPPNDRQMEIVENNNNNAVGIEVDSSQDKDVVVEVSGGPGQRDSYKLLSYSHNLVCSPNKMNLSVRSPRRNLYCNRSRSPCSSKQTSSTQTPLSQTSGARSRLFTSSPNTKLAPDVECRVSTESPEAAFINNSSPTVSSPSPLNISLTSEVTSLEDADQADPLLASANLHIPFSRPVNRSLLQDPEFRAALPPRSSLVTYRAGRSLNNNIFSTIMQPSHDNRGYECLNRPVRETYV